jgi:hypothetical protein
MERGFQATVFRNESVVLMAITDFQLSTGLEIEIAK